MKETLEEERARLEAAKGMRLQMDHSSAGCLPLALVVIVVSFVFRFF